MRQLSAWPVPNPERPLVQDSRGQRPNTRAVPSHVSRLQDSATSRLVASVTDGNVWEVMQEDCPACSLTTFRAMLFEHARTNDLILRASLDKRTNVMVVEVTHETRQAPDVVPDRDPIRPVPVDPVPLPVLLPEHVLPNVVEDEEWR